MIIFNRLLKTCGAAAILKLSATWALAGGFESPGLGAKAGAMGGAFIALADDWTAIYWNPAGLSHLEGRGIGASIEYLSVRAHDSQGLANPIAPLTTENILRGDSFVQLGGEPTAFKGSDSSFAIPLPALGGYGRWRGFVLAGGSYAPLGFSFEVRDRQEPGYDVRFKSRGYILNHNLSIARKVWGGLRAGAGMNVVQARLTRYADKLTPGYVTSSSAESDGWGVQGVFGLQMDLGRWCRAGAVYRTGHDLAMSGKAHVVNSLFPLTVPGLGTLQNEFSAFEQMLRNPTTYGVGLAFKVLPSFTVTTDWQRTQWSASRVDVRFGSPGLFLQNQSLDPQWTATSRYRFGAEWRATNAWSLRGGYFRDPAAVSIPSQALTQLIDVDTRYYTFGIGYHRARWRGTLSGQYAYGQSAQGGRRWSKEAISTTAGVEYAF